MKSIIYLLLLLSIILTLDSCKMNKELYINKNLPHINKGRLIDSILTNEFNYETFYAKKMNVDIIINDKKKNFNASLRIVKDNFIQLSITAPLGIELFRILLTADSVRFVDFYNKHYFISDYQRLEQKMDIAFNYNCLERLLTNRFITLGDCNQEIVDLNHFKLNEVNQGYRLSNMQERAIGRKIKKLYKKKRKNKDHILITEELTVDPTHYRPIQVGIMDYEDNNGFKIIYSDFKKEDSILFPSKLMAALYFEGDRFSLEIDFNKIYFDTVIKSNTRIPKKYKRVDISL